MPIHFCASMISLAFSGLIGRNVMHFASTHKTFAFILCVKFVLWAMGCAMVVGGPWVV